LQKAPGRDIFVLNIGTIKASSSGMTLAFFTVWEKYKKYDMMKQKNGGDF
jgi:hypothetical protein